jgi:hypothetical protein
MKELIVLIICIIINAAILFFVVRKATRSDEQIELLKSVLASLRPEEESAIAKLTQERAQRYK